MSPWDVFSMLTAGRLPGAAYKVGIVLLLLIMENTSQGLMP